MRTLLTRVLCRHRAEPDIQHAPGGVEIERCTGCGACWVTHRPGTRVRAWWAL